MARRSSRVNLGGEYAWLGIRSARRPRRRLSPRVRRTPHETTLRADARASTATPTAPTAPQRPWLPRPAEPLLVVAGIVAAGLTAMLLVSLFAAKPVRFARAIHEAGHCVAAYFFGAAIRGATIRSGGSIWSKRWFGRASIDCSSLDREDEHVARVAIAVAGAVATEATALVERGALPSVTELVSHRMRSTQDNASTRQIPFATLALFSRLPTKWFDIARTRTRDQRATRSEPPGM